MSKKDLLLDAAEQRVRQGGYNNFSFRELADEIGIKSASVHYHFPTKADMGAELAVRYTHNFLSALGDAADIIAAGDDPVARYIAQFKRALTEDKLMCMCGLLAAESGMLPDAVREKTKAFFEENIAWLATAFELSQQLSEKEATNRATEVIAKLQGAMLISQIMEDSSLFDVVMD